MKYQADEEIELGARIVETGAKPKNSVIWLHGLGADGSDFEPIVSQLMIPSDLPTRFIFPDAPLKHVTLNGGHLMRAWYDIYETIDINAEQDEDGVICSSNIINLMVKQEIEQGIDSRHIILAGFSQGGAIALYSGLHSLVPLGGVMALSTYLPPAYLIKQADPKLIPNILMVHGTQDTTIPIQFAKRSKDYLEQLGLLVQWQSYPMAHSVCDKEIALIRDWLIKRLSPKH